MKGRIVVVPFPYTNLNRTKRRPVLILHETKYDVVVASISSVIPKKLEQTDVLITSSNPSFARTQLIADSVIQLDKIGTIEKSLILRFLGYVDDDLKSEINAKLAACYRL